MKKIFEKHFMYLPLILVEAYLLFTILLYQFGPLDWKTENKTMFWLFLLAYHAAFIVGYVISIQKIQVKKSSWDLEQIGHKTYRALIWAFILICVVCACIEYKNITHASSYIPYELPGNFWNGLINPGEQYYNKFVSDEYVSNKLVTIFSALFSFIFVSMIPFLVVSWKRVSSWQKLSFLILIFFRVVVYVSVGTNKGIFDTMFNFVGIILILSALNKYQHTDEHIEKKTLIKVSLLTLGFVIFSFSYFTISISSRVESPVDYAISGTGEVIVEPSEEVEEGEQDGFFKRMYYSVSNYLTQGYYGMSLALDEEFTTTYGIGHSQFLKSNFKSLFGIDVQDRTYQHKITKQWDENGHWHSFYSYIANDVSFYGVIPVMLVLGLYFGCICKDVIMNNSLIGKMLLPLFMIMFMYMPANNQVFTAMATFTAFFELTFLWFLSKSRWIKGKADGK